MRAADKEARQNNRRILPDAPLIFKAEIGVCQIPYGQPEKCVDFRNKLHLIMAHHD
jgi:hypothetical protein